MRVRHSPQIDVVVVSYNSRKELRGCVLPFVDASTLNVIVVDNASPDASLEAIQGLPVTAIQLDHNLGFAHGCNVGWRAGHAPYVLFLNPDATIEANSAEWLARVLDEDLSVGAVAPKIVENDGTLDFSQRRFPRTRSTFAQALFLHRVFPRATWADEVIRDEAEYERAGVTDWVSGACILVRRLLLEQLRGFDEGFFMYCEDKDLCRRIGDLGYEIRFEPAAIAIHEGGASRDRNSLLPVLAASRLRYAAKHHGKAVALAERAGIALGALTHVAVGRGGIRARKGYLESLIVAVSRTGSSVDGQFGRVGVSEP